MDDYRLHPQTPEFTNEERDTLFRNAPITLRDYRDKADEQSMTELRAREINPEIARLAAEQTFDIEDSWEK